MSKLQGKTLGLKKNQVKALERLMRRKIPQEQAVSAELASEMAALSSQTRRCIGVVVDRRGRVIKAAIGNAHRVDYPNGHDEAVSERRLSGLRFIQSSFGDGGLDHSDLLPLARHRLDALIQIKVNNRGEAESVRFAKLVPPNRQGKKMDCSAPIQLEDLPGDFLESIAALEEELHRAGSGLKNVDAAERAILVGVHSGDVAQARESIQELAELARTAGIEVLDRCLQRRDHPDPRTVMGSGLLEEIVHRAAVLNAGLLIINQNISPVQCRNLERASGLRVFDRTMLILEIFGRRAVTRDGKIRVELARLQYLLPFLSGRGGEMSRLGGGHGAVRGSGEQKLEIDRRVIRRRIDHLEDEIEKIGVRREELRKRRRLSGIPTIALVGYANAGKSTLFNAITKSHVHSEDLLFATLETTVRRVHLPGGTDAAFIDTVGFLRDLPTSLLDAFRATIEEIDNADLILHLVDSSHPSFLRHMEAVEHILDLLGLGGIPRLVIFNKRDLIDAAGIAPIARREGGMLLCALDPSDVRALDERIEKILLGEGLEQ